MPLKKCLNRFSDKLICGVPILLHIGKGFGQKLVVSPVRAVYRVRRSQSHARPDCSTFLTDGRVRRPVHEVFARELEQRFFKRTDEVHLPEHGHEKRGISCLVISARGRQFYPR